MPLVLAWYSHRELVQVSEYFSSASSIAHLLSQATLSNLDSLKSLT